MGKIKEDLIAPRVNIWMMKLRLWSGRCELGMNGLLWQFKISSLNLNILKWNLLPVSNELCMTGHPHSIEERHIKGVAFIMFLWSLGLTKGWICAHSAAQSFFLHSESSGLLVWTEKIFWITPLLGQDLARKRGWVEGHTKVSRKAFPNEVRLLCGFVGRYTDSHEGIHELLLSAAIENERNQMCWHKHQRH